ncbi:trypsin-like peptidase domain-containing protein [Streptomyces antibioticus]|uniref:VMAP-C domain-containing protein n=1 Tax=Streptomyces antibioticus TaxID=1890 RepID=UPI003F477B74
MAGDVEGALPRRVQIQGHDGVPAGSGFLITPSYVLTCAHVVTGALGLDPHSDDGPRASVRVTLLGTPDEPPEETTAEVLPGCWLPLRDSSGDAALLALNRTAPPPSPFRAGVAEAGQQVRLLTPDGELRAAVREAPAPDTPDGWGRLDFDAESPRPGFSGGPLIDAEGAVVGIVTALQHPPDGRRGRFLPLSAALDRIPGLAPADGLALREHGELVESLVAVPVVRDPLLFPLLVDELRTGLPPGTDLGPDGVVSTRGRAMHLVRQLGRDPRSLRLLVDVLRVYDPGSAELEAFAALVDKVSAPSLLPVGAVGDQGTWERTVERQRGRKRRPFVIRSAVEPPVLSFDVGPAWEETAYHLTCRVTRPDGSTYTLWSDRSVPREDLPRVVRDVVRSFEEREVGLATGPAPLVEFLLPFSLMNLPVDRFDIGEGPVPSPLGLDYPVVVRPAELVDRHSARHRWHRRWSRLRDVPPGAREPRWLKGAGGRALVLDAAGLTFPPTGDQIAFALLQGVPVFIWTPEPQPATEAALMELARTVPVERIPEAVRSWRIQQVAAEDGGKGPARATLVYADPERPLPVELSELLDAPGDGGAP